MHTIVVNIVVPLDSARQPSFLFPKASIQQESSSGSGFFVQQSGTILTNAHVVADTSLDSEVTVTTSDGVSHSSYIHSIDPFSDLAIIKLKNTDNMKFDCVKFGANSDLRAGDWVVAVGSPLVRMTFYPLISLGIAKHCYGG